MKLYFLRHAQALEGVDDAARPLSAHGKKEAREMGRFLRHAAIEFDAAYCSPLVRAKQTADIVLDLCGAAPLEIVDALLNETSERQFGKWLENLAESKHVLLVGHAPSLAERVRCLVGISKADGLKLPKGALACVETQDRRTASLKFLIAPKLLGVRDN